MMLQRILFILVLLACMPAPAFADFDAGKKAYDKKDWPAAIMNLRPLAETGDDRAMILLGNMYASGYGVIPSHKEAFDLYKRAAVEKNNPQAMDALGAIYVSATGVDQNIKTALQWFLRSASLGDQKGAFFYATILAEGNKTPQNRITPDPYTAYKWFRIAASEKQNAKYQSYAAKISHGIAVKLLSAAQVAQADKEVAAWKPVDVKSLGPVPEDPPQAAAQIKNSAPPPAAPNTPLPHSGPQPK